MAKNKDGGKDMSVMGVGCIVLCKLVGASG